MRLIDAVLGSKQTLLDVIRSERKAFVSPFSGGRVHFIDSAEAAQIELLIRSAAGKHSLDPILLAAWIDGESAFDPAAVNPNKQRAKAGETEEEAFAHTDWGIAQFDGATLTLLANAGTPWTQLRDMALNPNWAIEEMAALVASLIAKAQHAFESDPTLLYKVPDGSHLVLAAEGYNRGPRGALDEANTVGETGDWHYGKALAARYADFLRRVQA